MVFKDKALFILDDIPYDISSDSKMSDLQYGNCRGEAYDGCFGLKVTADILAQSAKRIGAAQVPHHACGICGEWMTWQILGEKIYYRATCLCEKVPDRESKWEYVVEWLAMQKSDSERWSLLRAFGVLGQDWGLSAGRATSPRAVERGST